MGLNRNSGILEFYKVSFFKQEDSKKSASDFCPHLMTKQNKIPGILEFREFRNSRNSRNSLIIAQWIPEFREFRILSRNFNSGSGIPGIPESTALLLGNSGIPATTKKAVCRNPRNSKSTALWWGNSRTFLELSHDLCVEWFVKPRWYYGH